MITQKTILIIYDRSRMACEACHKKRGQEMHHVFFKSSYFGKDKNRSWNLAFICRKCHNEIHNQTTQGKLKDYELKTKSIKRRKSATTEMDSKMKRLEIKIREIKKVNNIIRNYENNSSFTSLHN